LKIRSKEELIDYVNHGHKVKYVFFWGHQKPVSGVSKSCFSQWYESPFVVEGVTYLTAEHFMMSEKARLFRDDETKVKVISARNPGEAKKLGRKIKNFDEQVWIKYRFDIVAKANIEKFSQNPELREYLLSTGSRILVEASPVDKIWGIGLDADNPLANNPNQWKGINLLGFALMDVRDQLKDQVTNE
jgi:ribA/ribD-fused uncharacterized protein